MTKVNTSIEAYDFKSLNGIYHNEETDVTMEINFKSDDSYSIRSGKNDWEGQIFAPDILWANGSKIEIMRDEENKVSFLLLNSGRIRNVKFRAIAK